MVKKTACSCTVHKNNTVGILIWINSSFLLSCRKEATRLGTWDGKKKDVEDISVDIGGDIMLKGQIVSNSQIFVK